MITSFCLLTFNYSTNGTLTSWVKVFWGIYLFIKHGKIFSEVNSFCRHLGKIDFVSLCLACTHSSCGSVFFHHKILTTQCRTPDVVLWDSALWNNCIWTPLSAPTICPWNKTILYFYLNVWFIAHQKCQSSALSVQNAAHVTAVETCIGVFLFICCTCHDFPLEAEIR